MGKLLGEGASLDEDARVTIEPVPVADDGTPESVEGLETPAGVVEL